ncbi:unnamed protein product [Bursaphelenchus xylophilus]|uniref:Dynactin subunit 1 n=1 Tax=Bursaphelenchus xylophilus TaxID=6326 RepID=A0A7I8WSU7_BURXY|nr:unnamed protein product [Bursaphelenchus xylophilus]CAG9115805.1 unnamed protein product [Bursaphelenchus xylophilus]
MSDIKVGDRVDCGEKGLGTVEFNGATKFSDGVWVGIRLDEKKGKNDGSVQGVQYFKCDPQYGVFMRPETVKKAAGGGSRLPMPRQTSKLTASSLKKPSVPSARSSRVQTPKLSPSTSVEKLAGRPSISRKSSAASSIDNGNQPEFIQPKSIKKPESLPKTQPVEEVRPPRAPSETPSVKELAKKIDSVDSPVNLNFKTETSFTIEPANQTESFNIQILKDEIADLNDKLENLRNKRKEDLAKLTEFDNLRIQFQTLVEYKSSATEEMRNYRRKIEDTEAKLADAEERLRNIEGSVPSDLENQLELMTLDKELAEEKVEMLQQEVNEKSTRIEELEVELDLIKTSMENETTVDGDMAGNSVQVRSLNQQLEKCQAVIVRMRDIVNTTNMEKQMIQQRLEECQKEYEMLQLDFEKKSTEVSGVRAIMSDLQDQVESALGSTKMVEHLTANNLELEDQVRNLIVEKEHYYEMYLLSDDIANATKEEMVQARQECNSFMVTINEKDRQIRELEGRINEYENFIQKFRQKISDLNDDIVGYKDQINVLQEQLNMREGDGGAIATFNATRDFSKIVSGELNAIELKYSKQLTSYLKEFLPDNFNRAGGDHDCILLTVFFPRMAEKSELLVSLLHERYPDVTNVTQEHITLSHKGEQWAHVRRFHYQLLRVVGVMRRFESVTKICTVESLQRLAIQRSEITSQERIIDQYFDLMKQNLFDENTSCDTLEHCVNTLNKTFIINLSVSEFDTCVALRDYLRQFTAGLAWAEFNCLRLKLFLLPEHSEGNDFTEFLDQLTQTIHESSSIIIKASKLIPSDKTLDWNHDLQDLVASGETLLDKVAKILHDSAGLAGSQLTTNDVQGFSLIEMKEFIQSKVEKRMEGQRNISEALNEISSTLDAFKSTLNELTSKLDKKLFEKPLDGVKKFTPLTDRAMGRKQDVVDVESLRWQITKKEEEYKRVVQMYKNLEDSLCTLKIQLERERRRHQENDKNENIVIGADKLQEAIQSETRAYREKLDELEKQLEEVEKARDKLKKDLEMEKKGKFRSMSLVEDSGNLALKLDGSDMDHNQTKKSLLWTQDKVRRLQAELSCTILSSFKPLKCPERVCGPISLVENDENSLKNKIQSFSTEVDILSMEYKKLISVEPNEQGTSYKKSVIEYNNRVNDLRYRIRSVWEKQMPQIPMPSILSQIQISSPVVKKSASGNSATFDAVLAECKKVNEERKECLREILSVFG